MEKKSKKIRTKPALDLAEVVLPKINFEDFEEHQFKWQKIKSGRFKR